MKIPAWMSFALALALIAAAQADAQEKGAWRAASSTARAITGDIALSTEKITIDYTSFPIAQIRSLTPAEVSAVFDSATGAGGSGTLYKVSVPAATKFLHKNTLCGGEETQWMVAYAQGRNLQLAFFSGQKAPVFTLDAVSNSTDLCGTYTYTK
jgi:hypothetical protein